jgi:cysteine desulfurase
VPLVVAFGAACEIARAEMPAEAERLLALRERLRQGICERLEEVTLNGHPTERLPGNLNLGFAYVDGNALLMNLRDVAVSAGSACTSADPEPSYVLRAMGVEDELAHSSIRFGLGRFNTAEEVDHVIASVTRVVTRLREQSPLYEMAKGRLQSAE